MQAAIDVVSGVRPMDCLNPEALRLQKNREASPQHKLSRQTYLPGFRPCA